MFTRIVVPVDDSSTGERALPVATALARLADLPLQLVEIEPVGGPVAGSQRRLADVAASLDTGAPVDTTVETTTASIGRALGDRPLDPGDIVCMATHGRGIVSQLLFGSIAETVIRRSGAPVLVVGPRCTTTEPAELRRPAVMALSSHSVDHDVMATAAAWSVATGAPIRAIHVIIAPSGPEAWDRADDVVALARHQAHELGIELETEVVAATDPDRGLAEAATAGDAGCIITGSHRHGVVGRFVMGSTVAELAHRASCPILVAGPHSGDDDGSPAPSDQAKEVDHGHDR